MPSSLAYLDTNFLANPHFVRSPAQKGSSIREREWRQTSLSEGARHTESLGPDAEIVNSAELRLVIRTTVTTLPQSIRKQLANRLAMLSATRKGQDVGNA